MIFAAATALLIAQHAAATCPQHAGRPPNVLLITIDDLNDWVGVLGGHPQARTPNIDALAARGVLFTNAHCQAPVCTPSRASLFTGRLPTTTGMYFLQPSLARARANSTILSRPTLVERFAREGYRTLGVGKLYHGGGEAQFFDSYGGARGGFGPSPPEKLSYPQGHPLWDWGAYPDSDEVMPDTKIADWAIDQLATPRAAEDREPFFLAVGFWRPHVPMCVPQPWFDRIGEPASICLPEVLESDRDDLPRFALDLTVGHPAPRHAWMVENDAWRGAVHAYLASCAFVDAQVGRVLDALAASPHADDTIVVLLSDHGFHLGEKGRWAKRSLWEESTRVPLIVAEPDLAPGRCDQPVGLVDLYPTLLARCGLAPESELDGHDLSPLLVDPGLSRPDTAWPHAALTTFGPGNHAVRTRDWRYVRYADGSEELYDHRTDPHEWRNVQGGDADLLARLRAFLPTNEAAPVADSAGAGLDALRAARANAR